MNQEQNDQQPPRTLRVCEECRALTPVQVPRCASCGALSIHAMIEQQQAQEEQRFTQILARRPVSITWAILILNLAIYLLMVKVAGGGYVNNFIHMDDIGTLIAFGAKTNQLLQDREWFRFVTPIFIHGGLLHLASNSYAIWMIGPLVEKLYGGARFFFIYMAAGIGGVFGSYVGGLSRSPNIPGVGASGAIFGLFGLLLIFSYRYRRDLSPGLRQSIKSGIVPVIVVNLVIGFSIPSIDNAAHIGGLVSGMALCLIVPYLAPDERNDSLSGMLMFVLAVSLVIGSFTLAWQRRTPYLQQRVSVVREYITSLEAADVAITDVFRDQARGIEEPRTILAQRYEAKLRTAEDSLAQHPGPDPMAEAMRLKLLAALRELIELLARPDSQSANSQSVIGNQADDEWEAISNAVIETRQQKVDWVNREGARYGFRIAPSTAEKGR